MNNTERNCDTCNDSYYMTEKNPSGGKKLVQLQHCRNTVYNSPAYTHQMLEHGSPVTTRWSLPTCWR